MSDIQIHLDSKQVALEKYLPFVKQGALMTSIDQPLKFGEEHRLTVKLPELKQEISCDVRVVWISGDGHQEKKKYGLQFLGDEGFELNQVLENYLVGLLKHNE